jgi:riboflavin synthase
LVIRFCGKQMFTGLVESLGLVDALHPAGAARRLQIKEPALASQVRPGESIAVNGACLTVVACDEQSFHFEVGPETLAKTNLGELKSGDRVNLERSLRLGDRLGGHWVQGHVDGVGQIARRQRDGEWELVWFGCAPELAAQMVPKGSVAVDGISLTVVEANADGFSVALIPHTLAATTLGFKPVGATVNLETDILAKYIWKYLQTMGK